METSAYCTVDMQKEQLQSCEGSGSEDAAHEPPDYEGLYADAAHGPPDRCGGSAMNQIGTHSLEKDVGFITS